MAQVIMAVIRVRMNLPQPQWQKDNIQAFEEFLQKVKKQRNDEEIRKAKEAEAKWMDSLQAAHDWQMVEALKENIRKVEQLKNAYPGKLWKYKKAQQKTELMKTPKPTITALRPEPGQIPTLVAKSKVSL